jgi:hypothetical protein
VDYLKWEIWIETGDELRVFEFVGMDDKTSLFFLRKLKIFLIKVIIF